MDEKHMQGERKAFDEIFEVRQGRNLKVSALPETGYPVYGANGRVGYYHDYFCEKPSIIVSSRGASCGTVHVTEGKSWVTSNSIVLTPRVEMNLKCIFYILENTSFTDVISGSAQPQIIIKNLRKKEILFPHQDIQEEIADIFSRLEMLSQKQQKAIQLARRYVEAVFVEMFGDLWENSKEWPMVRLDQLVTIETNMVRDFADYQDVVHLGIENIEKETGEIIGVEKVANQKLMSGKYWFTPEHIIYSKIRPDLNKVALPDFSGLCSADAYPLLPRRDRVNRYFLAQILRSQYFLHYILPFSSRTSIPKVNQEGLKSFICICPPLELQEGFAQVVQKIEALQKRQKWSARELVDFRKSLISINFLDF